ncbi:MAG TPA: hypothetical protein DCL29_07885 [Eubacterium sp.]|nr:hypothetical protein [Eubacterium sp.]
MAMTYDGFEKNAMNLDTFNISDKLKSLNEGFKSSVASNDGIFSTKNLEGQVKGLSKWLGVESQAISNISLESVVGNIKQMYKGVTLEDGSQTLGLKKIGEWRVNKNYKTQIIRAKAGYAAEVISTTKENILNEYSGNGLKTYRADDLPELFKKNDPYVDKVRVDVKGNIVERIQTKFVGKNGKECFNKLNSKKFEKYFKDGKVDKLEVPKDYFKDVKSAITEETEKLEKQLDRVTREGSTEVQEQLQSKIDKLKKMDEMIEQSNTTAREAIQAAKHPKIYAAKEFAKRSASDGVRQAGMAMMITGAISTVDNVQKVMDGSLDVEDAVINIGKDTGTAGAAGFGIGFISTSVSGLMVNSGNELIRSVGKAGGGCLPAAIVSYGIEVHESVVDFAKGEIDKVEFADSLAEGASKTAGGFIGGSIGSVAGPAGTVAGAMVGAKVGEVSYEAQKAIIGTTVDIVTGETTINEVAENTIENTMDIVDDVVDNTKEIADKTIDVSKKVADKTIDVVEKVADKAIDNTKELADATRKLASSTVGYVVSTEAYATAVEQAGEAIEGSAEAVEKLGNKAKSCAGEMVNNASKLGTGVVKDVKSALTSFNIKHKLPF